MKQSVIFFSLILYAHPMMSQSLGPTTINSSGGGAIISGNSFEYAIAEMSVVTTFSNNNTVVTQGVLQPHKLIVDAINDITLKNTRFSIFPNPTSDKVTVQLLDNRYQLSEVHVLDLQGKIIFSKSPNNTSNLEIDLTNYANGIYLLKINNQLTYKIIKK